MYKKSLRDQIVRTEIVTCCHGWPMASAKEYNGRPDDAQTGLAPVGLKPNKAGGGSAGQGQRRVFATPS